MAFALSAYEGPQGVLEDTFLLPHGDAYLHAPRLVADGLELHLHAIRWREGQEEVARWRVAKSDDGLMLSELPAHSSKSGILALDAAGLPAGTVAEREDRCERARVFLSYEGPYTAVMLHADQGEKPARTTEVWGKFGTAAAPCIAPVPGGHWIAFHHNVREDNETVDIAKWIAMRFVTTIGEVLVPEAPMLGRDRDLDGEEQSFEFPSLVVGEDGAVALFGRGSHNFWRQDLNASGFSERIALSDGGWGSRGRHIHAMRFGDSVLSVRREKRGLALHLGALPKGGAPRLVASLPNRTTRSAAKNIRESDPAERWGMRTYFGDLQQHSAHSDGVGCADEVYRRARYQYGDDFVALTDHESFLGKRTSPGEWEYLQEVADEHDAPGDFASILAYEWTGKRYPGPGHKCVYLPHRGVPIVSRDEKPSGRDAVRAIAAQGAICAPHHIGWTGCDEDGHEPLGQPVWEICSCHGCYEHADHPLGARGELTDQLVLPMLMKGHRFGFTGSSDSHGLLWHHGESRKRDPYRTGLTAVQCERLDRASVFAAIKKRRCYATSGAKILLDASANGQPMGSELPLQAATVQARVIGESAIAKLEAISDRGLCAEAAGDGKLARLQFDVVGLRFLYIRATQEDGEMAWSSPFFFGPTSLKRPRDPG